MTVAWVLGSGGLLGGALCRALRRGGTTLYFPSEAFRWHDESTLGAQIASAVAMFAARVVAADRWEIYWAAGIGRMGSAGAELATETRALAQLTQWLAVQPALRAKPGTFAFASSAGAVYAGSADDVITENTRPVPTTPYGREKLVQERLAITLGQSNPQAGVLIARISTLYGPGQSAGKQQGLLAHMARSILRNRPIQIYVPYDTIRDYIYSDEAAAAMVDAMSACSGESRILTKIIASEQPVTIAEIISIFKRVARRAPRIVTSANKLSQLYSRRVQFRSVVGPLAAHSPSSSMLVGVAQLMAAERMVYARGQAT